MTLETTSRIAIYQGNGVTTIFPWNFRIDEASQLTVSLIDATTLEVIQVLATGSYTAVGFGDDAGGTVTYPLSGDPIPSTQKIVLLRTVAYTQDMDIENQGGFFPEVVEQQLDLIVMQTQQLAEQMGRAVTVLEGADGITVTPGTAGQILVFNEDGDLVASDSSVNGVSGNMFKAVYDPQNKAADAFESGNQDFQQTDTGSVERSVKNKLLQYVDVEDFGAIAVTEAELLTRNGDVADLIAANDAAFAAAYAAMAARGGGFIFALGQFYVLGTRITRASSTYLVCSGVGEWEPIFPNRAKTWEGTTLLFKGTGTANLTFDGVTSAEHGGGWREDPDNPGTYFKLWSGYNSDATGTTPATQRQFSAAIFVGEDVRYSGMRNVRICNWIGTDGISEWSDVASTSLGDDWDFGYLVRNGEYIDDDNIQVVGGWREAAHALITTAISASTGERNHIRRAKFNGVRGHIVRAPDRWKVTATTANSITIRWSSELFFASGGGSFRGGDNVTYTYTGVTHAGSDANYVFTGVTPDPTGITQIRFASTGMANTEYEDVYTYGLDHVSGDLASTFGFTQSKGLEVSGFPLRGVKFTNYKVHTAEPVTAHSHDSDDLLFVGPQFEGGGFFIASPQDSVQVWAAAPVGDTQNLVMFGDQGTESCDLRLFLPRTGLVQGIQLGKQDNLDGSLVIRPMITGRKVRILTYDEATGFELSTGGSLITVGAAQITLTGSGGNALFNFGTGTTLSLREGTTSRLQIVTSSGTVRPGADNTQALGGASNRWSEVFAGNGTINTSDERLKREIESITEKVLDAWDEIEWCQYRFTDGKRLHMGLVAQRVQAAFEKHGLDAFELGLLCFDEWEDQYEEVHEERKTVTPIYNRNSEPTGEFHTETEIVATGEMRLVTPAGNRYGLRYEECLAVEAAYQRRRLARIEKLLSAKGVK
jgi:hypothetical protein